MLGPFGSLASRTPGSPTGCYTLASCLFVSAWAIRGPGAPAGGYIWFSCLLVPLGPLGALAIRGLGVPYRGEMEKKEEEERAAPRLNSHNPTLNGGEQLTGRFRSCVFEKAYKGPGMFLDGFPLRS